MTIDLFEPRKVVEVVEREDPSAPILMLEECKLSEGAHTVIEGVISTPEWITEGLTKVLAVIHTVADVNGIKQTESVYAEVLDVEDVVDDGSRVCLRIAPLYALTPLVKRWQQAKTVEFKCLLTQRDIGRGIEPVFLIAVYLAF